MSALAITVLLFYALLLAAAMMLWAALALLRRTPDPRASSASEPVRTESRRVEPVREAADRAEAPARRVSNDDVRGARAKVRRRSFTPETQAVDRASDRGGGDADPRDADPKRKDAFERFLRGRNDELDF